MLLAILDFARIASALVVVVGVTSHLGSGAALSPRRCRIASVGASNRTEMLRLRGVLLTTLRLLGLRARLLSILAVYKRTNKVVRGVNRAIRSHLATLSARLARA